jgi:hypothetical protein
MRPERLFRFVFQLLQLRFQQKSIEIIGKRDTYAVSKIPKSDRIYGY